MRDATKAGSSVQEFLEPTVQVSNEAIRAQARAALDREEAAWLVEEPRLEAAFAEAMTRLNAARAAVTPLQQKASMLEAERITANSRIRGARETYRNLCIRHTEPEIVRILKIWDQELTNGRSFGSAAERQATMAAYERLCEARLEVAPDWRALLAAEMAALPPAVESALRAG